MDRKIYKVLEEWKCNPNVALILNGARQVGKTYAMREFAKSYPRSTYLNLEENKEIHSIFENTNVAEEIYNKLSFLGVSIDYSIGKPLLILDEIQSCPKAYSALKPLVIDGRCDIIASGSLLGVELMKGDYLSPMGYVRFINVEPMDFEEFLWAIGYSKEITEKIRSIVCEEKKVDNLIVKSITERFSDYLLVGGMPKVVRSYAETKDYTKAWESLEEVYNVLKADVMRYSGPEDKLKILACLNSIPTQLAKENKTFVYKDIEKVNHSGRREYGSALHWLENAGIINMCYNLKEPSEPLAQMGRNDSFKIYVKDSGILTYLYGMSTATSVAQGDLFVNKGALMESSIAQALICNGYKLYYYGKSDSTLELDFIVNYKQNLTAIEVKSGNDKRAKSLLTITSGRYAVKKGIKVSNGNLEIDENGTLHLPLFGPWFFEKPELPKLTPFNPEDLNRLLE